MSHYPVKQQVRYEAAPWYFKPEEIARHNLEHRRLEQELSINHVQSVCSVLFKTGLFCVALIVFGMLLSQVIVSGHELVQFLTK